MKRTQPPEQRRVMLGREVALARQPQGYGFMSGVSAQQVQSFLRKILERTRIRGERQNRGGELLHFLGSQRTGGTLVTGGTCYLGSILGLRI